MFFDRFKMLCEEKSISCSKAATEIGLSNSIATKWKKTGATPDASTLARIAGYFGVSVDYLIDFTGQAAIDENMWKLRGIEKELEENPDDESLRIAYDILRESTEDLILANSLVKNAAEKEESKIPSNILPLPKMKKIPLLGTIACGEPILAEENIEGFLAMPENVGADFCLRCKGDSMINARIFDGDIVYIRQQPRVEDGEIAAVMVGDDEATLKRVRLFTDHIVLEPENPQYRAKSFWDEDMDNVRILGKAVAFVSTVI